MSEKKNYNCWILTCKPYKSKRNVNAKERQIFIYGSLDTVNETVTKLRKEGCYTYELTCRSYRED